MIFHCSLCASYRAGTPFNLPQSICEMGIILMPVSINKEMEAPIYAAPGFCKDTQYGSGGEGVGSLEVSWAWN